MDKNIKEKLQKRNDFLSGILGLILLIIISLFGLYFWVDWHLIFKIQGTLVVVMFVMGLYNFALKNVIDENEVDDE
jgi:hypothetical protein